MDMIRLTVQSSNKDLCCFVTETEEERSNGLDGWGKLPQGAGLLFAFPVAQNVQFWMSKVTFPIDIVMLDEYAVVRDIHYNCQPGSEDRFYGEGIKWVIEVTAGEVKRLQISEGTSLRAVSGAYEFSGMVRPDLLAVHAAYNATLEGEDPYGAVVVQGSSPVGWGWNCTKTTGNSTKHAEMIAINDAFARNSSADGGILYATHMPCMMCGAAAAWSKIPRIHYLRDGSNTTLQRISESTLGPVPQFSKFGA